jgi:hypothetical protein
MTFFDEQPDGDLHGECAAEIAALNAEIDNLRDKIQQLDKWCKAYHAKIFPEPDLELVRHILTEHRISLDAVSASNFRHVLAGVRKIIGNLE